MIRAHWRPLLVLTQIVLLANAVIFSGQLTCDPFTIGDGLATSGLPGMIPGISCYYSPGIALVTQPLGNLSAQDWLHGIIPWWNGSRMRRMKRNSTIIL